MGSSKIRDKHSKGGGSGACESLLPGMEQIRDMTDISSNTLQLFSQVLEAPDLKTQVECIRSLLKTVTTENYQIVSIVIVKWYFHCSAGLKKVISNSLNSLQDSELEQLISAQFSLHVRALAMAVESRAGEGEGARVGAGAEAVRQLLGGFDNFPLLERVIREEREAVLRFVLELLELQVERLTEDERRLSPVERSELSSQTGDTVRLVVQVVRTSPVMSDLLSSVSRLVYRIINRLEMPLDLRANAGHVYVQVCRLERERDVVEQVKQLLSTGQTSDGQFSFSQCGSVLSLLHGIVSTAHKDWVVAVEASDGLLSDLLTCYLTVSQRDRENSAVLGCSKGLLAWAYKLADFTADTSQTLQLSARQTEDLLQYVWDSLAQPVDSVKHNTKNLVKSVARSLVTGGRGEVVTRFLSETLKLPEHSKPRLVVLSCLVQSCDSLDILGQAPLLVPQSLHLLQQELALSGLVSDLLTSILQSVTARGGDWYSEVIQPVLRVYSNNDTPALSVALTNLLHNIIKTNKNVTDRILAEGDQLPTKVSLLCLKMSRGQGQPWQFERQERLLVRAAEDVSEETRLAALSLCVESHSSVEIICPKELNWMISFLLAHLALQSAASQQVLTVLASKMIQRMKAGAAAACKKLTMRKFEKDFSSLRTTLGYYNESLSRFVSALFDNLYPGANTGRRGSVLEILTAVDKTVGLSQAEAGLDVSSVVTEHSAQSLLECLHDSYEDNKERALSLLLSLPASVLHLDQPEQVRPRLEELLALMKSNKPANTVTASYQARLLLAAPGLHWVLADRLGLLRASHYSTPFLMALLIR